MEIWENQLATEFNSGGFQLSVVAAFDDGGSVKYIIRIEKPNWESVDYFTNLEGLKKLGELFLDLHSFATEKLFDNDKRKLRDLMTSKNIMEYAKFKKPVKISQ